jgi:hypothetical protein
MKATRTHGRQDATSTKLFRSRLLETVPIILPDGTDAAASLYTSPTRGNGRRVIVRDSRGLELFDSLDQFDHGNAVNALERWLAEQERLAAAPVEMHFAEDTLVAR